MATKHLDAALAICEEIMALPDDDAKGKARLAKKLHALNKKIQKEQTI